MGYQVLGIVYVADHIFLVDGATKLDQVYSNIGCFLVVYLHTHIEGGMFASYAYTYEAIYYWFGGIEEMRITVILQSSADDISYIIFEGSDLLISGGIGTGFVVRVLEGFIIPSAPI